MVIVCDTEWITEKAETSKCFVTVDEVPSQLSMKLVKKYLHPEDDQNYASLHNCDSTPHNKYIVCIYQCQGQI